MTSVVIIGAGPYALSLAAHLRTAGIDFTIFGRAMGIWRDHMPAGMLLKSDGCASNLEDPNGTFTLRSYCARHGIPYEDRGLPVALDTFVAYGLAFQKEFVPDLDAREITRVERSAGGGFLVHPSGGEPIPTQRVVVAVGISHFHHMPEVFAQLPRNLVSHSFDCTGLPEVEGRKVIVVGAGASALDTAADLHRRGSKVVLVSRGKSIKFIAPPRPGMRMRMLEWLTDPPTDIGPGWKNVLCTEMPLAFHFLPERFRRLVVRRHLGPAPGWFSREQTEGRFPFVMGATPVAASVHDGRVEVKLAMDDGTSRTLACDHVVAATGYKVDLRRIPFLCGDLLAAIESADHAPRLSLNFESSVRGLYFTGLAAANSFGPVLRFACGAKFATARLARHLAQTTKTSGQALRDAAAT